MKRDFMRPLATCAELLKVIEATFHRRHAVMAETATFFIKTTTNDLLALMRPWKLKLRSTKMLEGRAQSLLAAIELAESTLDGMQSLSYTRKTIVALGTWTLCSKGFVKLDVIKKLEKQMWFLDQVCNWQMRLRRMCDCSILFYHTELVHEFFADIFSDSDHATRLPFIIDAMTDVRMILQSVQHHADKEHDGEGFVRGFQTFLVDAIHDDIVSPLCKEIENMLRLHQYSGTQDSRLTHMKNTALPTGRAIRPIRRYIDVAPFKVFGEIVSIKFRVTHYLEREFYNLTVLALHDWRLYSEMRKLAKENYGIMISDSRLPMGTLDMGLDVLQIMRNIHVFVSLYNYNLNQQFFIEKKADRGSKHLNTININSIANSIRTHGSGMMNTCVNFTYQFLSKKFYIFSQFLFDDYIKSYLSRERRNFRKHDKELNHMYPYERALKFNKDIRKLGVSKEGLSFLGQFRLLITEIGNALGYIRMVRSAGMNWVSSAIRFVPDINNIINFESHCWKDAIKQNGGDGDGNADDDAENAEEKNEVEAPIMGANLSPETVAAAKVLDDHLADLSAKFAEGTDYFKVLVDVFREVMLGSDGTSHLKHFYMIVPSLTVNYVSRIIQAKDSMARAHKGKEAYFTDDGFAIGIAYILAILKQTKKFDSLHWFKSVAAQYQKDIEEQKEIEKRREAAKKKKSKGRNQRRYEDEDDDESALKLSARRLSEMQREFELLMFSFSGAKIFFKEN